MFEIEKTRMSKSMMLEHCFFINRKGTNIANKALDLFILEALFIKIVESILHSSIANHLPRTAVLELTMGIKKCENN